MMRPRWPVSLPVIATIGPSMPSNPPPGSFMTIHVGGHVSDDPCDQNLPMPARARAETRYAVGDKKMDQIAVPD